MNIRAEILAKPYDLPKSGQRLADSGAYSSPSGKMVETLHEYAWTHKRAADVLVWSVESGQVPIHQLGAPLLNLYRHAIELSLKDCLELGSSALGEELHISSTHSLRNLLELVLEQKYRIFGDAEPCSEEYELDVAFCDLVNELDSMDPTGSVFRYPFDLKRRGWKTSHVMIEVGRLRNGMDQIWNYLDCYRECVNTRIDAAC